MTNKLKKKNDRKTEGIKSGVLDQGMFDQLLVPEGFKGTYKGMYVYIYIHIYRHIHST
jgi:hypothetical protein